MAWRNAREFPWLGVLVAGSAAAFVGNAAPARADAPPAQFALRTDIPFAPGAQERRVDARSVFIAGTYQSGIADGWYYRFMPDGQAIFSRADRLDSDRVAVRCDPAGHTCDITADDGQSARVTGATGEILPAQADRPIPGMTVARIYAGWVLGGQSFAPPPPPPPPPPPQPPAHQPAPPQGKPQQTLQPKPPRPGSPGAASPKPQTRTLSGGGAAQSDAGKPLQPVTGAPGVTIAAADMPTLKAPPPGQSPVLTTAQPQAPVIASSAHPSRLDCSLGAGTLLRGEDSAALLCNFAATDKLTLHASAFYYPVQTHQKPWDPDYTYVASYALTPSVSLTYANYAGNYFPWHKGPSTGGKLIDGLAQVTYVLPVNNTLFGAKRYTYPDFSIVAGAGYSVLTQSLLQLGIGVMPTSKLSLRVTGAYYPNQYLQKPWDGDFSYTASYQITDNWSVQYNNYSGNRWLWDNLPTNGGRFRDGSLLLLYRIYH